MRLSRVLTAVLITTASACADDPAEVPSSEHGRWEVIAATRSHRPTSLLDEAYFDFDTSTHRLVTNLTGEETDLAYQWTEDHKRIITQGSSVLTEVDVITLSDTLMTLQAEMLNTPFTLRLVPAE